MANRTRSAAWEFFSKTGNANLAKCHICCSTLAYSGTTNLLKHLRAKHSAETAAVMQWNVEDGEDRTETDVAVEAVKRANVTDELNDSGASISPSQRSGRKNRSLAWNCFRKVVGSNVAECLFCGVHISQESGTTTCLMKHFMGKHPDVYAMHVEGHQEAVPHALSNDDSDPDYTPSGKQGSGRKKSNILGKRIKLEVDNGLDHLSEDTDGAFAGDGSLDSSLVSSFRNRSLVWQVFVKEPDSEYVKCTICGIRLKLLSGSTTTMLNHYISKHAEEYQEALTSRVQAADSRSALIKVHFDQLSPSDFWCCLCSRILRQPQSSTSNLRKHLQARHPKEFASIIQIMAEDPLVKVEDADTSKQTECSQKEMKSVSQIWKRHCRERESEHTQQMNALRTRLNTMKAQMLKLRREMAALETEISCTEKNRVKEVAREKELMARFRENLAKDDSSESLAAASTALPADNTDMAQNGFDQGVDGPITEAIELLNDAAVVEAVGSSVLMDIDSGRWTQNC